SQPIRMLHNKFGVVVGMTHVLLPFCVLAMYGVMSGINRRLVRAARVLGATPFQAFWKVYFPLSVPGISAGGVLVFIMALGYFITPQLLGGRQQTVVGTVIFQHMLTLLNWPTASMLGIALLVITLA